MTETNPPQIYAAMAKAMADIGTVGKTGVNKEQHYKFRSIEDVMSAVRAGLVKNGVFYLPTVISRVPEQRQTSSGKPMNVVHLEIRYDFYAADGSSVSSVVWGEGADLADKATNKAMSQALKYNLVQAFSIAAEDMQDADRNTEEAGRYHSAAEAFEKAQPAPPKRQREAQPSQAAPPPEPPAEDAAIDPEIQALADEASEVRTLGGLRTLVGKVTDDQRRLPVRSPSTGGVGYLGQYLDWRVKQAERADKAMARLGKAGSAAKFSDKEIDKYVVAVTGKDIENASAAELEEAAAALEKENQQGSAA